MNRLPSESRFDDLYQRYWDDRLSDSEMAEFSEILRTDPNARDWFRLNGLVAAASCEFPADVGVEPTTAPVPARRWTRRRALQFLGGGLAAGVMAGLVGRFAVRPDRSAIRLAQAKGGVTVTTPDGNPLPPTGPLPSNATIITHGTNSSALLVFPNGSDVLLAGDSSVAIEEDSRKIRLMRGSAIAEVRPTRFGERPLAFQTSEAVCSAVGEVFLTLTQAARVTEVGVHSGHVAVVDPTGVPIASVRDGELLTVRASGRNSVQSLGASDETYELDLTQPLPDGWFVGKKHATPDGPVLRPESWFDPYHQADMFQIRSHNRWALGIVRLVEDSEVSVRYRVRTSGKGQVCLVCRTEARKDAATGVLEWNGTYDAGGWRTLTVKASDMRDCKEAPKFGAPWIAFLLIFNTYGSDLGLDVAEFRVSRPGGPVEG